MDFIGTPHGNFLLLKKTGQLQSNTEGVCVPIAKNIRWNLYDPPRQATNVLLTLWPSNRLVDKPSGPTVMPMTPAKRRKRREHPYLTEIMEGFDDIAHNRLYHCIEGKLIPDSKWGLRNYKEKCYCKELSKRRKGGK